MGYCWGGLWEGAWGLSRQVCLLREGCFDLGFEGQVDFNRRRGRRTLLALTKAWKLEGRVGQLGVMRAWEGCH